MRDGGPVEFQMYALKDDNGDLTNYIKIRDLALALNGTKARFGVSWDGAVKLVAGAASDLVAFTLTDKDGGGYTYFQLRDPGQKLGFNVRWDGERGVVCIETDKPYTGRAPSRRENCRKEKDCARNARNK